MADRITLDRISTQTAYNLTDLYNKEFTEVDDIDSPYASIANMCDYYEPGKLKSLLSMENNSLSLFCLNTRGLRAHWDAFNDLVEKMNGETCKGSFDVIGLTELYSMNEHECSLNGYHPIKFKSRNDLASSRGGVGMYIKSNLHYTIRNDLSIFLPHVFESIFVEIRISRKTIIIGTIYRPNTPPKADLDIFMYTMTELMNTLRNEKHDAYIMGDVNINLLNFSDHIKTNDYLEDIFSSGFIPLITKPSRVTP